MILVTVLATFADIVAGSTSNNPKKSRTGSYNEIEKPRNQKSTKEKNEKD